jgi:corrinoid protein of di/trimethylamine methyltransferase
MNIQYFSWEVRAMTEALLANLKEAIRQGNEVMTVKLTENLLIEGIDPLKIFDDGLAKGLREVGDKFGKGEAWLIELLGASAAMEAAMKVLQPAMEKSKKQQRYLGSVLIGTVKGDIHDIGKNIVKTILKANGFEVTDLGKDVPKEIFLNKVKELQPDILGMSALLTMTMPEQRDVIEALKMGGLRNMVKVIIGGAMTTEEWAQEIGADGYGADQNEAVEVVKRLLRKSMNHTLGMPEPLS